MDQELIAYLEERFGEVNQRFDQVNQRFGEVDQQIGALRTEMKQQLKLVNTSIHGTRVLVEYMQGEMRVVAEGRQACPSAPRADPAAPCRRARH